jgi:hypothetical protein
VARGRTSQTEPLSDNLPSLRGHLDSDRMASFSDGLDRSGAPLCDWQGAGRRAEEPTDPGGRHRNALQTAVSAAGCARDRESGTVPKPAGGGRQMFRQLESKSLTLVSHGGRGDHHHRRRRHRVGTSEEPAAPTRAMAAMQSAVAIYCGLDGACSAGRALHRDLVTRPRRGSTTAPTRTVNNGRSTSPLRDDCRKR